MSLNKATHVALTVCLLLMVAAVAIPNPQEKQYKDRAEYDIISKVYAEQDPTAKLGLLDEWKQKYPETDYSMERMRFYLDSYRRTNQTSNSVAAAKEILAAVPNDFAAYSVITLYTPFLGSSDSAVINDGTEAANALLKLIPPQFATKPDTVAQEQWDAQRNQLEVAAHKMIGWGRMQNKDHAGAEEAFTKLLEIDPSNGQVSYWLGQEVLAQSDVEKFDLAFFSFARAAIYDGPNSMPAEGRAQISDYVQNLLKKNYGDAAFDLYWPKIEEMARAGALPSERIELKSSQQLQFEADQASRKQYPLLWVFKDLRTALTGAQGEQTWSQLRGALTPEMQLYVVSTEPPERPGIVRLSSEQGGSIEVVVNLANRLRNPLPRGRLATIEGVAGSLTRSPFRLTLNDGSLTLR